MLPRCDPPALQAAVLRVLYTIAGAVSLLTGVQRVATPRSEHVPPSPTNAERMRLVEGRLNQRRVEGYARAAAG